jgi:hypothetical protein
LLRNLDLTVSIERIECSRRHQTIARIYSFKGDGITVPHIHHNAPSNSLTIIHTHLLLRHQILPLPQPFHHKLLPCRPPIQIPNIIRRCLKVACRIITLTQEHRVALPVFQRLVEWDRWTHEFLLDAAEALEARLQFEVVVRVRFGNGGHDSYVVAFGADVVGGGDDGDVDV